MNILIAGGQGFIGYHLSKRLSDEGHKITIIDRKNHIEITSLSFDNWAKTIKVGDFDIVYHLAANSDISTSHPGVDYQDTFQTTLKLLDFCASLQIKKFVFASSSAVYGRVYRPITEYCPFNPLSFYGAYKAASESIIQAYAKMYGFKAFILRFPNVIGSHATHGVIRDLLRKNKMDAGQLLVLGTGSQLKQYIHVSELIDAIQYILKNADAWVNIYNIAPKGQTSVKEIAEQISKNITYTGDSWPGDCEEYVFNTDKLTHLGWTAKMTSSEAVKLAIQEIKKEI
jgi:UDP-glucose 4-epimerase